MALRPLPANGSLALEAVSPVEARVFLLELAPGHGLRRLAPAAFRALREGGRLFLEMGETQGEAVRALMTEAGFEEVRVHPDLAGRDRIAEGKK